MLDRFPVVGGFFWTWQDNPFVRQKLLEYVQYLVREYDVDAFRLDTAIYMPKEFLLLGLNWKRCSGVATRNWHRGSDACTDIIDP